MEFFNRSVVLALLLGLIATVLSGCADNGPGITHPMDGPGMVYHQIGDYVECERTETEFGIIEIPQFYNSMPQSESTKAANEAFAQIRDLLLEEIQDYQSYGGEPEEGRDPSSHFLCSYKAAFCGDIVSVMLEYEDFNAPGYIYVSYNLDAENGASPVDAAAVIENCGVSEETIKKSIRYYGEKLMNQEWEAQMLWSFAHDMAPIDGVGDPSMGFGDKLDEMVAMSLENPLVYGDEEQLYMVVYYPTEAGAGRYCKLIAISDDTYDIDYLSPETPFGEEFKSAITETGAIELVQRYLASSTDLPAGLRFETEFLMVIEMESGISEPCYEFRAFYDEGDHITTAGRYAVSCYSGKLYEYDPVGDAYLPCPNEVGGIDGEPVAKALDASALMAVYHAPDDYERWVQPKVREIDLVYEQTGDYYWSHPEAESMFVFAAEEGQLYGANVTVNDDGSVSCGFEDRVCATHVKKGDAVLFHAVRPEGQPSQAIILDSTHHGKAVYLLRYDGMNGTDEKLELVKAE